MAKLLNSIPELIIVLKTIIVASRAVLIFFVMWLIIIYVFAVIFRQMTDGEDVGGKYFASVPAAMNTLLLEGVLPDSATIVTDLSEANPWCWPIIMFFIALATLTVMYLLIGVLVDVVSTVASAEKEAILTQFISGTLREALTIQGYDVSQDGQGISRDDFKNILQIPDIVQVIEGAGVDVVALCDMSDMIFDDVEKGGTGSNLDFVGVMDIVLNMRGTNPATVKDVKEQLRVLKVMMQDAVKSLQGKIHEEMKGLRSEILENSRNMDFDDTVSCRGFGTFRSEGERFTNTSMQSGFTTSFDGPSLGALIDMETGHDVPGSPDGEPVDLLLDPYEGS
jgi:hypothetical protein